MKRRTPSIIRFRAPPQRESKDVAQGKTWPSGLTGIVPNYSAFRKRIRQRRFCESENHLKLRIEQHSPRDLALADSSSSVANQKADEAQKLVKPTVAETMTMNLRQLTPNYDSTKVLPILFRTQLRNVNGSRIRTTTGWPCLRAGANRQVCTACIASFANEYAVAVMGRISLVVPSAVTLNSITA